MTELAWQRSTRAITDFAGNSLTANAGANLRELMDPHGPLDDQSGAHLPALDRRTRTAGARGPCRPEPGRCQTSVPEAAAGRR